MHPMEDHMTTTSHLFRGMLTEPTAHHICDSGGIYGRTYQRNAERDFAAEPQATLTIGRFGPEITVSTYHHIEACLELDDLCTQFNALGCGAWNSDKYYGVDSEQECWLDDRGFWPKDKCRGWNTYNWDNNFDQILQGHTLERDGEDYVLLQVHGGCDARSGYTDAKLFKIQDWMHDYWLRDDSRFWIPRTDAEAAGYESPELDPDHGWDSDGIDVRVYGYIGQAEVYDHRSQRDEELPVEFWEHLKHQTIEGVQDACEH